MLDEILSMQRLEITDNHRRDLKHFLLMVLEAAVCCSITLEKAAGGTQTPFYQASVILTYLHKPELMKSTNIQVVLVDRPCSAAHNSSYCCS